MFIKVSLTTKVLNLKMSRIFTVRTGHSFLVSIRLQVAMQQSSQPTRPDRKLGCEQQFLLVMMPLCLGLIWPILSGINCLSDKLCRYNLDEDQRI